MASNSGNHLKALLRKNWILWKRNWCCSCFEIFLPFIICTLSMMVFRRNIPTELIPEQSYYNSANNTAQLFSNIPTGQSDSSGKVIKPPLVDCLNRKQGSRDNRNGYVAVVPKSNELIDKVANMLETEYKYKVKGWDSLEELFAYTTSLNYAWDVCFAIEIPAPVDNKYSYTLVFNNTGPPNRQFDDVPDTTRQTTYAYKPAFIDPLFTLWKTSGFLSLQNFIDNLILRKETGLSTAQIEARVYPIRTREYTQDSVDLQLSNNFGPFVVLPMILSFLRLTQGLLVEKEKKIREGMRIMGMRSSSFYLSWIIQYIIIYTAIAILIAIGLNITVFKLSSVIYLFIWFWLFSISLIFQSLFITSFFTRSKLGTIVAMLFFLFLYMIDFFFQSGTSSTSLLTLASLSTHTGITRSCESIIVLEANGQGVNFSNSFKQVNNYSVSISILMSLANIFLFAVLSLYLDQVIPNEFGKKKNPLFFLDWFKNSKRSNLSGEQIRQKRRQELDIELLSMEEHVEDVTQLLKDQISRNEVVKIRNFKKVFYGRGKPFNAVENLNLTMYKNQIFVLLGHNGAGKTTTLSMLEGILEISEGWAEVNGKDVETQMEEIRTFMGVCPQHDVLFDNLTVREHLELFASFKGMSDQQQIKKEVDKFINDIDLMEKANVLSKNLSGGQKRRLSVAIAFIGGSQLIYLDEPTSGMDTSARRYVWDMLKQYRNDRIIILTTHFMDEADYLGDRIAIMGQGKLICSGSAEFLKDRFGVGYNLTLVKEDNNVNSAPIVKLVKDIIPSACVLSNVSAEITIQLKNESISSFPQMFANLDSQKSQLKIHSYGISITTLEEVFLRVSEMNSLEKPPSSKVEIKQGEETGDTSQIDNFDLNSVRIKGTFNIYMTHFIALMKKRIIYFKRDTRGVICEVVLPIIVVIAGLAITLIQFVNESPPLVIQPSIFNTPLDIIYSGTADKSSMASLIQNLGSENWNASFFDTTSISAWDEKNFQLESVDRKGSYFVKSIDAVNQVYKYDAQVQTISKDTPPLFVNQMNNAILRMATGNSKKQIQLTFNPFPLPLSVEGFENTSDGIIAAFIFAIALSLIPASLIVFTVKERVEKIKHQQLVSGVGLQSYWMSNYFVDMLKHLFPSGICILMVLAFNINTFSSGKGFAAISILFILFGWAVIPFTYLIGFLFEDTGSSQVAAFFFNFVLGAIGPLLMMILRLLKSTSSAALTIQWFLRIFPSFCFGYGVVNIANQSLYATVIGSKTTLDVFDMDMAGGDIVMLAIQGFVYYFLIFVVENLSKRKSVRDLMQANEVKYVNHVFDSDVKKEMELIALSSPKDYSVRVENLSKVYYANGNDPKVAVDRVSFGIKEGDCFALLGVNGAGKTTTFKILAGEMRQSSGSAHIKGFDLSTQMSEAQKHIGYCPQFDALLENLTAREHLELYSRIKGIPSNLQEKLITQKIKEMGLSQFENKCAGTYSGGNKRKLSVAIAMLGNPPIVFLDEPSTGMDPEARRFMWNVISRISTKRKQSSIILTTHSMEEAEALCTKLTIMVNGTFRCLGTLTQIKNKFGQGYEVVVKTEIPLQEAGRILAQIGLDRSAKINTLEEASNLLTQLKKHKYFDSISEEGSGKSLFSNIIRGKGITAEQLAEFVCIEDDGERIYQLINTHLGEFSVIEHFSNLYRFKLSDSSISIGKIFDIFEKNKKQLNIASYNVRQATIEQIFNNFAEGMYDHLNIQPNNIPTNSNPFLMPTENANVNQKQQQQEMTDTQKIQISPNPLDESNPFKKR